jgi:hypothetical protein
MRCVAFFLGVAIALSPHAAAKGFYRRHAHAQTPAPPPTKSAPTPTPLAPVEPTPAPVNTQTPTYYVLPQVRRVPKSQSNTNSPSSTSTNAAPVVERKPTDLPHVSPIPEDPIIAYQKADAAKGFPEAQFALGVRYLTGNGVPRDDEKGKELIKAAADQGSERAKEKLRELHAAGKP